MTILFCDLVGFTQLTEALDAEDVATVQEAYFAAASTAVRNAGGAVEKFIGDAVVGSFGLPRADGAEPRRAVAAARQIVEAVAALGAALGLEEELGVRVGVNTGEVLVTFTDAARTSWRLTGDAVNTASRLQSAAPSGGVLLGPETALAVEAVERLVPAGSLTLKGKAEPLEGWLLAPSGAAPDPAGDPAVAGQSMSGHAPIGIRGRVTPTVGRDAEVARIRTALAGVTADPAAGRPARTQAVIVVAPPGTGKSRLLDELRTRWAAEDVPVWTAQVDLPGGSAYAPVEQLLRQAGAAAAGPVDELLGHVPLHAEPAELYRAWTQALVPRGGGPAVWMIEDLHRAGPDLFAFLRTAVEAPAAGGRLLVLTARPEVLQRPDVEQLGADVLFLDPLAVDATKALLANLVGADSLSAELLAAIAAASGGNPLFCEELLHSWSRAGVLTQDADGRWALTQDRVPQLPSSVQAVYQAQLDSLEADPRLVVLTGSVAGRTMPSAAVPALGVPDPDRPLAELTSAGLLIGPHAGVLDPASYTFRHALLWDVAYASLPRRERSRLHASFAAWAQRHVSADVSADVVARHLLAAHAEAPALAGRGDADEGPTRAELAVAAGEAGEQAARQALRSEPGRAADLLEQTLALPGQAPVTRVRRRLLLAEALRRASRLEASLRTFSEAGAEATRELTDPSHPASSTVEQELSEHLASIALGYEEALFASRFPRTRWGPAGAELLESALHVTSEEADPGQRGRLLAASARAQAYTGNRETGLELGREAVRLGRLAGDDIALAAGLQAQRAAQTDPADLATRLAALPEMIAAAERGDRPEAAFEAYRMQLMDALEARDLALADAARTRAVALASALAQPQYLWYPAMWAAMRALLVGELDEAGPLIDAFAAQGEHWGYTAVGEVALAQAVQLAIERGDPLEALIDRLRASPHPGFRSTLALCEVLAGDPDTARRTLQPLLDSGFTAMPQDLSWPWAICHAAEATARLEAADGCRVLVELLAPWQGHAGVLGAAALCMGDLSLPYGLVLAGAGRPDEARIALESALLNNAEMGARPAAARARAALDRLTRP